MKRALIVGVGHYKNGQNLLGAVNDADQVEQLLSRNHDGSLNFECRKLVTSKKELIDYRKLNQGIDDLFATYADAALLYFSGHGYVSQLGGYLCSSDVKKYAEGVLMNKVLAKANNALSRSGSDRIKEIIIVLDCCHADAFGNAPSVKPGHVLLAKGLSVMTAALSNQYAVLRGDISIFTRIACEALEGGAADLIGEVNVAGIYNYAEKLLGPWEQRPAFESNINRMFTLRKAKPKISIERLRRIRTIFSSKKVMVKLDPSFIAKSDLENDGTEDSELHKIFADLKKMASVGLVVPMGSDTIREAAENSKRCKLTLMGQYYWKRIDENNL